MIEFHNAPLPNGAALVTITAGNNLDDALAQFGRLDDCIGCSTAVAAPPWTSDGSIDRVLHVFSPLAEHDPTIRPPSGAGGLLRGRGYWTDVNVDAGAQRLRSVKMPSQLINAQRLIAVNDLRGIEDARPIAALGLWALFAHPVVRASARLAGARDGLTAEIALAVHPDRYVLIESDRPAGVVYVIETPDPIAADLLSLALRQKDAHVRGVGPWEDPLVQAATELDLGIRTFAQLTIDVIVSPTLSSQQQEHAAGSLRAAAELIGVRGNA